MSALCVEGDDLDGDPLLYHIVAGEFEDRRVLGHRSCLNALAPVEPGEVGYEAFDDKHPARAEHTSDVAETLSLPGLAEQAEQRVEDQIHQAERPSGRDLSHVADDDGDRLTTRLGPQPFYHRGGGVDPLHRGPPGGQRQRDPAGADRQLEHPAISGQPGEELHSEPWVHVGEVFVIHPSPAIAVERRIFKPCHASHSNRLPGRQPPLSTSTCPHLHRSHVPRPARSRAWWLLETGPTSGRSATASPPPSPGDSPWRQRPAAGLDDGNAAHRLLDELLGEQRGEEG